RRGSGVVGLVERVQVCPGVVDTEDLEVLIQLCSCRPVDLIILTSRRIAIPKELYLSEQFLSVSRLVGKLQLLLLTLHIISAGNPGEVVERLEAFKILLVQTTGNCLSRSLNQSLASLVLALGSSDLLLGLDWARRVGLCLVG